MKSRKLMLVDRPRLLLSTICDLENSIITLYSFKQHLEKLMNRKEPIHIKTAHTYFYTATTYELLLAVEGQKGVYHVSETGKYLCRLLRDPTKRNDYSGALRTLLLSNPRKGFLFREFLDFVKDIVTDEEIYNAFQTPTGKTLIAWGLEARLIVKHGEFIGPSRLRERPPPSLDKFWDEMLSAYNRMQRTRVLGVKRLLVRIDELRLRVSCSLGFEKKEEFDDYLQKLQRTNRRRLITLYGAPSHMLEDEKKTFNYKGMIYAYISLRRKLE